MRKIIKALWLTCLILSLSRCKQKNTQQKEVQPTILINYHLIIAKNYLKTHVLDSLQAYILLSINRCDSQHLNLMDSFLAPDIFTKSIKDYFPFPQKAPFLDSISKIIFFSYPTQSFGAYENGNLVYTGATNMGRKSDPTPIGLFFTNWKAEETHSTFNDEWDLKWDFNIENKLGVGWHEYSLPGYPVSHSCMRLSEQDAKYLYNWADQWNLYKKDSIISKGTPVVIFGEYHYGSPKPWFQLVSNKHTLDITEEQLKNIVKPYLDSILFEQKQKNINIPKS